MPRISVVLPVYNGAAFIRESIESVINQTFKDFELIVIDDGSEDSTAEIVDSFSDKRICFHRLVKNSGSAVATNEGYLRATGEFIAHIDADDIAMPDRLARQLEFLSEHRDVVVMGGAMQVFGGPNDGVAVAPQLDSMIKTCFLPGADNIYNPTAMIRKSFLDRQELRCDPELNRAFDWGLWVEIMWRGGIFSNCSEPVTKYRIHPGQQSNKMEEMRPDLARVRCRVIALFFPDISATDRAILEPLLQWVCPPPVAVNQFDYALAVLDQALSFKQASVAGEDRQLLERFLLACKGRWLQTRDRYHSAKGLV